MPSHGLSSTEAAHRLEQVGPNELDEKGLRWPWRILWEQFTATMVLILLGAALISALLGEFKDAIAIGGIVILFALPGLLPGVPRRAGHGSPQTPVHAHVRVVRSGTLRELSSTELVRGDLILLEAGNLVPADMRAWSNPPTCASRKPP